MTFLECVFAETLKGIMKLHMKTKEDFKRREYRAQKLK